MSGHHQEREPIVNDDGAPVLIEWFDGPNVTRNVVRFVWAVCIATFAFDLIYWQLGLFEHAHKHGHYWFEEHIPAFHGFFGFFSFIFLVLTAIQIRKLIMREEGYYD
ncbi:MAG: hypothetical protein GWP91_14560 [Rhodobacterales bacterium]|nr:hypothetical protein [Rhodobacterales bacterium]